MTAGLFNQAFQELENARPYIEEALRSSFSQEVTIRRFDGEVATSRAIIGSEEDKTVKAPPAHEPEVGNRTLQVLLRPDAPVARLGYTLTAADGRVLIPIGEAQNPANKGLCWVVRMAALVERTRVESLTFTRIGTGFVRDPVTLNHIPAPGEPLTVPARLTATDDPRVRDMVGADTAEVVLVGRWGTLEQPLARPDGLAWGSHAPLTLDGQRGTVTVKLAYPDADLAQEQQFGARFVALWKAGTP